MESVRTDVALVDLSHPIVEGMTTYPGLPAPEITTFMSREESSERLKSGVSFHIGRLCMVAQCSFALGGLVCGGRRLTWKGAHS